jgi:hypothetical protein
VELEDVVHVLRNGYDALRPNGLLLDIHPTADDSPVRAAGRGLGFIDAKSFHPTVAYIDESVDALVADRFFDDVRRLEREIVELYESAEELFDTADDWTHHRIRAPTRRRTRAAEAPIQVLWRVRFRLLRKRAVPPRRRL